MENFAIIALAEQLKPALADFAIRRITQHQSHGFIFHSRSARLPALKILMNSQFPALYISESRPFAEAEGSDFLMVLRKHLTSAELLEFRKPLSERILEFEFQTVVPSKDLARITLVLELIPNAPNILLLDMERRVLASFSPITPQHGMGEYEAYSVPVSGNKIALERIAAEEFPELENLSARSNPAQWLVSQVGGLGPVFSSEIAHRQRAKHENRNRDAGVAERDAFFDVGAREHRCAGRLEREPDGRCTMAVRVGLDDRDDAGRRPACGLPGLEQTCDGLEIAGHRRQAHSRDSRPPHRSARPRATISARRSSPGRASCRNRKRKPDASSSSWPAWP